MRAAPAGATLSQTVGAVTIFAGALLAGCATIESSMGPIGGDDAKDAQDQKVMASNQSDVECPPVTVRSGASAWQIADGSGGATNVRYQGALGQFARECAVLGETMTMRVGVEGRVLVGPKGGPGTVTVPLRIALVQEGPTPKPIWSKFYGVPVTVPPNASQAIFSQVEDDLTFAMPADRNVANYVVYVGFDPKGSPAPARAQPRRPAPKPKAPPPTAARPAPPKPQPQPQQARPQPQSQPQQARPQPQFEPAPSPPSGVFTPPPGQTGSSGGFSPPPKSEPQPNVFAPPPGHSG